MRELRRLLTTVCALAATACVAQVEEPREAPSSADDPLYGGGSSSSLWPWGAVTVCVDFNAPVALVNRTKQILSASWSSAAKIDFSYQFQSATPFCEPPCNNCVGNPWSTTHISFIPNTNGSTSFVGRPLSGQSQVNLISNGTDAHLQYEVIHEMGHVLGFWHDQQRPDNWTGSPPTTVFCNQLAPGEHSVSGGTYWSAADNASVMSYCAGQPTALSARDISSALGAYGPR